MSRTRKTYGWTRRAVDRAISLWGLIRVIRAEREVELRSPEKRCPECGEMVEVVVMPGEACGICWSKQVIANWQVMPARMTVVRVRAAERMRRQRRK